MPKVNVPGVGILNFPDGMSQQAMAAAIQKNYPQIHTPNPVKNATAQNFGKGVQGPFALPPNKGYTTSLGTGMPGDDDSLTPTTWTPQERQMAQNGVDITTGAPQGLLQRVSLLTRPQDKDIFSTINQYYGHDVNPSRNQYGDIEYTGPNGRRMLLNSHMNMAQNIPTIGGAANTVGQVGGAVAGEALSGPVAGVGVIPGTAAGQALADVGKHLVAKYWFGMNNDSSFTASNIGKNAATAGAGAAVGWLLGGLPKAYRLATKANKMPDFLNHVDDAEDLLHTATQAQNNLNDFFSFVGSNPDLAKPVFSVAELVPSNQAAGTSFAEAARSTVDSSPWLLGHGDALINLDYERKQNVITALTGGFNKITDAYKPDGYQFGEGTQNVRDALLNERRAQFNTQKAAYQATQDAAAAASKGLPQKTAPEIQQDLSNLIYAKERAGWQQVKDAYSNLQQALGVPQQFADNPLDTDRYLSVNFDPSPRISYTPTTIAKLKGIWGKGLQLLNEAKQGNLTGATAEQYFDAIPSELFEDPASPQAGLKFDSEKFKNSISLRDFIQGIQDRRAGIRQVSSRLGSVPPNAQLDSQVTDILRDNVNQYFQREGDPTLGNAWEEAEQAAREYRQNFRSGVLGSIIDSSGGKPNPVYNQVVSNLLLSGGKGNLSQNALGMYELKNIVQNDPEAEQQVRNMIWGIYNEVYHPGENATAGAVAKSWSKFSDDMRGPISLFFDDNDKEALSTFQGMSNKILKQNEDLKNFRSLWQSTPWGQIPFNSQSLARAAITDTRSPQSFKALMNFLNVKRPDLIPQFQAETSQAVARAASDAQGNFSPNKLGTIMDRHGGKLSQVLGPEYVANVKALARAAQVAQAVTDPGAEEPHSIFEQIIRWQFAPPLSGEGRAYTGLQLARKRAALRVVYNALSSVDGLNNFVSRTRLMNDIHQAGGILGALGGSSLMQNPTAQKSPPTGSTELPQ